MFHGPHEDRSQPSLILPGSLLAQIERESRNGHPEEICGLLLGLWRDQAGHAYAIRQSPNASPDDRRKSYFIPIPWLLHSQRQARASGWEIIGAYHSHPDTDAQPSRRDLNESWPEFIYLIASVAIEGTIETQAWRLQSPSHAWAKVPIQIS